MPRTRHLLIRAACAAGALIAPALAHAAAGDLIVVTDERGAARDIGATVGDARPEVVGKGAVVIVDPAGTPASARRALAEREDVVGVLTDTRVHSASEPWQAELWGLAAIGAPIAWSLSRGTNVQVGVIDSGVDFSHPDLAARNAGGHDFVDDDADPGDCTGHGTHVAGTLAASANDIGVVGVAPEAMIRAYRALGCTSGGWMSDTLAAMDRAGRDGVAVANMSLSGETHPALLTAGAHITRAWPGTLYVAAAGNNGGAAAAGRYPCALAASEANVMCVAALTRTGSRAGFSNVGAPVSIAAPGEEILSTWIGGGWAVAQGTSMAAPHVAGAAALLRSRHPDLSGADLRRALEAGAQSLSTDAPVGGRLDASGALLAVDGSLAAAPALSGAPRISRLDDLDPVLVAQLPEARGFPTPTTRLHWESYDRRAGTWTSVASDDTTLDYAHELRTRPLRVRVVAENRFGRSEATSASLGATAGPQRRTSPRIIGRPQVGRTLTVRPGTWREPLARWGARWEICRDRCRPVARTKHLRVTRHMAGARLRVTVTAIAYGGVSQARTSRTARITR